MPTDRTDDVLTAEERSDYDYADRTELLAAVLAELRRRVDDSSTQDDGIDKEGG